MWLILCISICIILGYFLLLKQDRTGDGYDNKHNNQLLDIDINMEQTQQSIIEQEQGQHEPVSKYVDDKGQPLSPEELRQKFPFLKEHKDLEPEFEIHQLPFTSSFQGHLEQLEVQNKMNRPINTRNNDKK
jgi:hypothetical protein